MPDVLAGALSWELDGLSDETEYLDAMLEILQHAFPSDTIGWNSVDQLTGSARIYGNPVEIYHQATIPAEVLALTNDHPMILSYGAEWVSAQHVAKPRRMSDIVSRRDLKRTRAYAELLEPLHADRQFTILTSQTSPAVGTCWTFTLDSGDFADSTIELAMRLQPLLISLERAQASLIAARRPASGGFDDHGLTTREIEVLSLVAKGLTASAIASVLRITTPTVRKHLENTYRKLGQNDRLLAVRRAQEDGLIPR
jgi:DNA-binding CsgD family transcriptional regulator